MKKLLTILILGLLFVACTKSGSDNSDGGERPDDDRKFTTDCGVVSDGSIRLPVESDRGVLGSAQVISSNQLAFTNNTGSILVKLQGIADANNSTLNASAVSFLRRLTESGEEVFIEAQDNCTTTVAGGGVAKVGQVFTSRGRSFSEALLEEGLATVEPNDACGGNLIGSCYEAILDTNSPVARISNFLWKPVSERDGNLAILLSPGNVTVVVNGVTLSNTGASNGRATTARADRSGGSFGSNVRVQVFDSLGRALIFPNGETTLIIANGSSRVEL